MIFWERNKFVTAVMKIINGTTGPNHMTLAKLTVTDGNVEPQDQECPL